MPWILMEPVRQAVPRLCNLGSEFFSPYLDYPQWFETLKTTTYVAPPVVTVWVNGTPRSGTVYVSHNNLLSVAASFAPNGFVNTPADWWMVAQYHGYLYYRMSNGSWATTAVPTWQKPLATMNQTTIWNSYPAAGDSVTFYIGADLAENGTLDSPYYYTYVTPMSQWSHTRREFDFSLPTQLCFIISKLPLDTRTPGLFQGSAGVKVFLKIEVEKTGG